MVMTKNEILGKEAELYEAIKNNDVAALGHLLHDDLLFVMPGGGVITKEMDLQSYSKGTLQIDELVPDVTAINIIVDVAVITLQLMLKGSYEQVPFEGKYSYIRFWRKCKEGIKVIGGSGTALGS